MSALRNAYPRLRRQDAFVFSVSFGRVNLFDETWLSSACIGHCRAAFTVLFVNLLSFPIMLAVIWPILKLNKEVVGVVFSFVLGLLSFFLFRYVSTSLLLNYFTRKVSKHA